MFQSVIQHIKLNANAVVTKIVGRAVVAVPFVIAFGFAVAALAVWLVGVVGAVGAYAIMAGGFAVLGIICGAFVMLQERHQEVALRQAQATRAAMMSNLTATPLALVSTLRGVGKGLGLGKALGGRAPLAILLLVAAGMLLRRSAASSASTHGNNSAEHEDSDARVHH